MSDLDDRSAVRRTTLAAIALGLSEILGKIATFLVFLFAARLLGIAEFGVFSWGLSLGMLLMMIPSFGLDARVLQLGSLHPERIDRLYGALVGIRLIAFGVVLALTAVVTLVNSGPSAETLVVLSLVAACLLDPLNDACRSACGALQRQEAPAVVMVAQRFLTLALCIGPMAATGKLWCGALGYLIGVIIGNIGMFVAAGRAGARPRWRGSLADARDILRAAPVLGMEAMSTMGLFRIDAAIIALMVGTSAVGVYNASYRIFETVLFVSWSMSRAFMPIIAARPADARHVGTWTQRWLVVVVTLYLPYGTVLAVRGDDLVGALYGDAYVTPGLMASLAFAPVLFGMAHLAGTVLVARRPDPLVVIASLAALAVNVGLDVVLLPRIGIVGAGVATSLAFVLQAAILLGAVLRFTGPLGLGRRLGVVLGACGVAAVALRGIGPLLPSLVAGGLAYLGAWLVLCTIIDPALLRELREMRRRPEATEDAVPGSLLVDVTP
ncbi:oligosaccharide flippase family protein [Nocardioides ultimimeridianus]